MTFKTEKFVDSPKPEVLRCPIHDSTYSPGSSCYYCRTSPEKQKVDAERDKTSVAAAKRRVKDRSAFTEPDDIPFMEERPAARTHDPATSKEADRRVDKNERRRVVEEVFRDAYPKDLANEEVAQILGVKDGSVSPRVTELRRDFRALQKTSRRYTSEDGGSQQCHVWVPLEEREEPTLPNPEEL